MAETVVALAESQGRGETVAWQELLRRDPSLGWHFFTHHHDLSLDRSLYHLKQGIDTAAFLEALLEPGQTQLADWSRHHALKAYRHSQYVAAIAERLAEQLRLDPLLAHCLGQLTQLGPLVESMAQKPVASSKHHDASIYTRQLIRRAHCAPWLRDLILSLDLPSEADASRWSLLLQFALGLVSKSSTTQSLGQLAAQRLNLSWEAEQEFATQLGQHLPMPTPGHTAEATQLLLRSWRLVQHQPATTLSFTIKQLENEVEDLRSRLARRQQADSRRLQEQKLTAVAELAAGAGHEINNPLAVISGQAQYLLKGEEDLNRAKALERIIGQTTRIHVLLRDLMLFARPPEPVAKSIAISKLVKTAIHSVNDLALSRGIRLETGNITSKSNISCDVQLLGVALKSLLTNAIEAAPAGGWVRIDSQVQQQRLILQVQDSGPGVPAHLLENIFDPFFSGRNAGRGVGLGLSKVWRIAQVHGGDVRVEQKPGQPTSFVLEVPLRLARTTGQRQLKRPA
ncbi:MAG: ATP-binding protein [Gemmatales bacterium]